MHLTEVLGDWVHLLLRWSHLIFGISWIGSSFYFMWLDASLEEPAEPRPPHKKDVEGELWMTHSGGFYLVERKRVGPGGMPKTLHWFKYEALFTWVSGIFLLGWVYYLTGGAYLIDPNVSALTNGEAIALGVASLILGWAVYDGLWISPVGKRSPRLANVLSLLLACGMGYAYTRLLSGRAAFIHVGALFGTIMVANVWMRILPAQRKMIRATEEGREADWRWSAYAKHRSVHNSYMTFPVLFMMLSNHYPAFYAHSLRGVILLLLVLFGAATRHVLIGKTSRGKALAAAASVALLAGLVAVTAGTSHPANATTQVLGPSRETLAAHAPVPFSRVQQIVQSRCVSCHSARPAITTFGPMPGGVDFEQPGRILALSDRIWVRAVETETMPLLNQTGITQEERLALGAWVFQGAKK